MIDHAINISSLSYLYQEGNVLALSGVDLSICAGEFVTIIGPSGCGKSTLLHIMAGFELPSSGGIACFGKHIDGPSPERSIILQRESLFPWLTASQNVSFPMECRGVAPGEAADRAQRLLSDVGLNGFEATYPRALSGGMYQRVVLARLVACDAKVMLMDEPFGHLDAQTRLQTAELLLRLWDREHRTVLFVTHDTEEALLLSDRILVMSPRPGRIIDEIHVPLSRPRSGETLFSEQFVALRKRVFASLGYQQTATS